MAVWRVLTPEEAEAVLRSGSPALWRGVERADLIVARVNMADREAATAAVLVRIEARDQEALVAWEDWSRPLEATRIPRAQAEDALARFVREPGHPWLRVTGGQVDLGRLEAFLRVVRGWAERIRREAERDRMLYLPRGWR